MVIHRSKPKDVDIIKELPNLWTHLMVSLAELNANSEMFGGKESESYKIKYKNYEKLVKRLL